MEITLSPQGTRSGPIRVPEAFSLQLNFTKQVVSFYIGISIPAYHLHIKDGHFASLRRDYAGADRFKCLGAARPSSVLYWVLSLSVGRL